MYGNGYLGPFMMPNTFNMPMQAGALMRAPSIASNPSLLASGLNPLKRGGLFSGLKSINWSSMLGNTSKALGVVKEAIPVVKEVGPMMNNMRSIFKIASAFNDATDAPTIASNSKTNNKTTTTVSNSGNNTNEFTSTTNNITNSNNMPNFFL